MSPDVAVEWIAPAECPDASAVRADVERLGGEARADARARVVVTRDGERWIATIAIDDADRAWTRSVDAGTCAEIASASALVVAIAFRSPRPAESPHPGPPPASGEGGDPSSSSLEHQPVATSPPSGGEAGRGALAERGAEGVVGAGFAVFDGPLPSPAAAASLWVALRAGRARFSLGALVSSSQSATIEGTSVGADLSLAGASLRGCYTPLATARFALGPCAGADVARIRSSGFGMTDPADDTTTLAAVALGATSTWRLLGPFDLSLQADALVPTARPRFVLQGGEPPLELYAPSPVWARVVVGGEVRF